MNDFLVVGVRSGLSLEGEKGKGRMQDVDVQRKQKTKAASQPASKPRRTD